MVKGRMQRQIGRIGGSRFLYLFQSLVCTVTALSNNQPKSGCVHQNALGFGQMAPTRRNVLNEIISVASIAFVATKSSASYAEEDKIPETFDIDSYLRTGYVSNPMGVSGQAGKSRPETGVFLRDGSEVFRDSRTGDVLAEILVGSRNNVGSKISVLASFQSPWPLASGSVFDVECRNPSTGDGSFLAVTGNTGGKGISDLPDSFFLESLIAPTSRFSFYGTPTDIKIKKSGLNSKTNYRFIDLGFSTLSQSTNTEIPRRARIVATIPDGSSQAVMLVGSASAQRWRKGSEEEIAKVIDSFQAVPAPPSSLRMRAKDRRS